MSVNFNSFVIDDKLKSSDNQWIKYKSELIEDDKYNVYQGVGDYSLVKLLIKEDAKVKINKI